MLKDKIAGVIKQFQNRNFQSLETVTTGRKKQVIPKHFIVTGPDMAPTHKQITTL
jgi:hypothetical protein